MMMKGTRPSRGKIHVAPEVKIMTQDVDAWQNFQTELEMAKIRDSNSESHYRGWRDAWARRPVVLLVGQNYDQLFFLRIKNILTMNTNIQQKDGPG